MRRRPAAGRPGLRQADRATRPTSTSSSASSRARATRLQHRNGHVILNGKRQKEPFIRALRRRRGVRLPRDRHDSGRSLLHDGRQPWLLRRQPVLGTGPTQVDHRRRPSPPTGLPSASGSSRPGPRRAASASQRAPPVPVTTGRSGVALRGRRRRGRARLPGRPAGRGRGAVRLRAAVAGRPARRCSALNDSKQHTAEMREELYPRVLRAAVKVAVTSRCVRGIDERGLHKTNLAALSDTLRRVARRGLPVPVGRLPGAGDGLRAAPGRGRRRDVAPRSPRPP